MTKSYSGCPSQSAAVSVLEQRLQRLQMMRKMALIPDRLLCLNTLKNGHAAMRHDLIYVIYDRRSTVMRRSDREITDYDEILELVKRCDVCRVAMFDEQYPYIVPMNFGYKLEDDGAMIIYFHGAKQGKKHDLLSKNNHVGFEMDISKPYEKGTITMQYESLVGFGDMEVIDEESERIDAHLAILRHYNDDDVQVSADMMRNTCMLKLNVKHITGKRNLK